MTALPKQTGQAKQALSSETLLDDQTNEACHLQLRSLFQMPAYSAYPAYSANPAYPAYGLISLTFLDFIDIHPCLLTKEQKDQ